MRNAACCLALAVATAAAAAQTPLYRTAQEPSTNTALSAIPGGVMFSIPGIATDFILSGGCQYVELADGTARLTGRIRSNSRIYAAFLVDLAFSGRVDAGDVAFPPVGSPDLQLFPAAYAPIGPVDPQQFHYYTAASGTLNGVRELDGARVTLSLQGPAAQVGLGANNRNGLLGIAATFAVQVLQQPTFPFGATSTATFAADLRADRSFAATHVMVDTPRSPMPSDRAMVLPGLPGAYLFVPAASWVEYTDGRAELHGTLARIDALDDKWQLDLVLTGRTDPGEATHPPLGSPALGLYAAEYAANGGAIDPTCWHYYTIANGTLSGRGDNVGGRIDLTTSAPFQIGGGANQANLYVGFSGQCAATVAVQPTNKLVTVLGDASFHALLSTFPVLPFPTLTVPTAPPALSTLTEQGFVIEGQNLAWVNAVAVGPDFLSAGTAANWYRGYYRILDNNHVEVHPVPGHAAGGYSLRMFNPAIVTNSISVQLVEPTAPTLRTESTLRLGQSHHMLVHRGGIPGNVISAVAFSPDLIPSVLPGFLLLDIGNDFTSVELLPPVTGHDPVSGIAAFTIGPVPASIVGAQLHFQAILLELGNDVYPLRTSDTWTTSYTN